MILPQVSILNQEKSSLKRERKEFIGFFNRDGAQSSKVHTKKGLVVSNLLLMMD
jgi:hypothetical protein